MSATNRKHLSDDNKLDFNNEEAPEDPRCPIEYQLLMAIESVAAMSYEVKLHRLTCPLCNRIRKQPRSQRAFIEREVAA